MHAIQWDGDTIGTWPNIQAWTKKASLSRKDVLRIQPAAPHYLHVGVGDWLVMDHSKAPQVMPMTNGQFQSTYVGVP